MAVGHEFPIRILGAIMYRYYNAHPQKLSVGDCGGKAVLAYYEITRFPRTYVGKNIVIPYVVSLTSAFVSPYMTGTAPQAPRPWLSSKPVNTCKG